MKMNEIETLLQRFYEGVSTPQEELILEKYFRSGSVDPELEEEGFVFIRLMEEKSADIPVPADLESEILKSLENLKPQPVLRSKRLFYTLLSSAAGLLLLVSSLVFLNRQNATGELTDPQLAYSESREALDLISSLINQGTSGLSGLDHLNKAVKPLEGLNSLDRAARELSILNKLGSAFEVTSGITKD